MKSIDLNKPFTMKFSVKVTGSTDQPVGKLSIPIDRNLSLSVNATIKDDVAEVVIPPLESYVKKEGEINDVKFEVFLDDIHFVAWEGNLSIVPSVEVTMEEIESKSKIKVESSIIDSEIVKHIKLEDRLPKKVKPMPKIDVKKVSQKDIIPTKKIVKKQPKVSKENMKSNIRYSYLSNIKKDIIYVKSILDKLHDKGIIDIKEKHLDKISVGKSNYNIILNKHCVVENFVRFNSSDSLGELQDSFAKNINWKIVTSKKPNEFILRCNISIPSKIIIKGSSNLKNNVKEIKKLGKHLLKLF